MSVKTASTFRKYHRMIGFFMAGVMMIYASSGVLLIFRTTDFLKFENTAQQQLEPGLAAGDLGKQLRIRDFKVLEESLEVIVFEQGHYNKADGTASVTSKEYPTLVKKLVNLHKATPNSPLFFMNVLFGLGLLFLAISSFIMFVRQAPAFKSGLKFAAVGVVVALVMVIFA
ncbi:PepSY domain-containing protein [Halioxenophilus sp. WMMB6]|uniref:PepSY domain-containing protein n=1 Tax=Halioxenophilus sp. WMMB6 TaxID=3073815 RepID=UPI00295E5573|nr:PepSY domain-containing protein [Halioxenophilus sp. WMMB6]